MVYITQMSYTAVPQLGQLLAREASSLLADHPAVHSDLSYARVQPTTPRQNASLPRAGAGTVHLGPGKSARLFLFFATWDQETSGLAGQLDALNRYQAIAARSGLPRLTAVDEASVEPGSSTLTDFLGRLPRPLSYPVAIDRSGKVADGYEVLALPWFVLGLADRPDPLLPGGINRRVAEHGRARPLCQGGARPGARNPSAPRLPEASLAGSPRALASLHVRRPDCWEGAGAGRRIRALRGYPIVINAWASWCGPCRAEFGLFASASARYGRRVAFLGADTDDSAGDARTFLAQHPVSYPSYQTTTSNLSGLSRSKTSPAPSSSVPPARSSTCTPVNTTSRARSTRTSPATRVEGDAPWPCGPSWWP